MDHTTVKKGHNRGKIIVGKNMPVCGGGVKYGFALYIPLNTFQEVVCRHCILNLDRNDDSFDTLTKIEILFLWI